MSRSARALAVRRLLTHWQPFPRTEFGITPISMRHRYGTKVQ